MMQAQFKNAATAQGSPCELMVTGEIDLAMADRLYEAAAKCFDTEAPGLVIDLSGVTFLDSTGIGALVRVRNTSREQNRTMLLANPSERVVRILQVAGVEAVFDIAFEYWSSSEGD